MSSLSEQLRHVFLGRQPLIQVVTWEEDRLVQTLRQYGRRLVRDAEVPTVRWSCTEGFDDQDGASTGDPLVALERVLSGDEPCIFVMHDLGQWFGDPRVLRSLREAYRRLFGRERYLFITSPQMVRSDVLEREMVVLEDDLPSDDELLAQIDTVSGGYRQESLDEALRRQLVFGLRGLSLSQSRHTLHRVFRTRGLTTERILEEVLRDKEEAVRKAGLLEFIPQRVGIDQVGGLENLKSWLERRKKLFSREAIADGLPSPKGMLVMGMSGCGKSLAAKAVAELWQVPLFRLDMNLVSSGLFGSPEAAFDRATRTIESLAPAVLWIDEIENSLGADEISGAATSGGVFASFLTWMQEKPPMIFVAATANRIAALPAEVIRKGRFDEVFFVDLPTESERQSIFEIHLSRNGVDPGEFNLELLSIAARGWNGAEIEQSVVGARVDAYADGGRLFEMKDLTRSTSTFVPLSRTMHEQMKKIRSWAFGRATLASAEKYVEK